MNDRLDWWKRAVIYQIYPRSFQDSTGDGNGDLQGILHRLDYLQWLGVEAVWVSVMYKSPHVDGGYDVSDYTSVDPRYGTMADLDALVDAVHRRGMRIILGLVPNHTSDVHPWFLDARSSRDADHADWYHWCDKGRNGGPPNDWTDALGNSAWTWCEERSQFYYHAYFPQQPDLNWRNRHVRDALYDIMRFWLRRGIDGFRIDVLWRLIKDRHLRNDPPNHAYDPDSDPPWKRLSGVFSSNQPEVREVIREMRAVADEFGDRVLIGEVYAGIAELMRYYDHGHGAQLPFNFQLIMKKWNATRLAESISRYFAELPERAWPNWVLGNHDQKRVATREGESGARIGAVLLLTLGGTPFIYNGDEIGMHDVEMPLDRMHDPMKTAGARFSRDPARTPMQWSDAANAGFTTGDPWLPVAGDFRQRNVAQQRGDAGSILNLYRDLIALRAGEDAILEGEFIPLTQHGDTLAFVRAAERARFLIVVNFGDRRGTFTTGELFLRGRIAIATDRRRDGEAVDGELAVGGRSAYVIRLES